MPTLTDLDAAASGKTVKAAATTADSAGGRMIARRDIGVLVGYTHAARAARSSGRVAPIIFGSIARHNWAVSASLLLSDHFCWLERRLRKAKLGPSMPSRQYPGG
mgnify:CR=1 FL=1